MNTKMTVLALLALAAVRCFGLTAEGRMFKAELQLADFVGPTNNYVWACPHNVTVSNQLFTTKRVDHEGNVFSFDLVNSGGLVVGDCGVRIEVSSAEALDAICDRIRFACAAPVRGSSAVWHVERDAEGNVLLGRYGRNENGQTVRRRTEFFQTYGNLYIHATVNTNRVAFSAQDFALPLILGGLQNH